MGLKAFDKQMDAVLQEIGVMADEAVEAAALAAAKEAVKELRVTSPSRNGDYAKGWGYKKDRTGRYTVYNKKYYYLTHLLENGHRTAAKKPTKKQFVEARKHIAPTEDYIAGYFEEQIIKNLEEGSQ